MRLIEAARWAPSAGNTHPWRILYARRDTTQWPLFFDLLVERLVIVEAKAVEKLIPLYEAQLLSYLKLSNLQVGLLINFNVPRLKDGLKRVVNNLTG